MEYGYFSKSFTPEELSGTYRPNLPEWKEMHVNIHGALDNTRTWGSVTISGQPPGKASTVSFIAFWDNRK